MDNRRFSILLRLTPRPPAAQRLRELVWALAGCGCETLFVDWRGSFPWSVDEWSRSGDSYREEFVPGLCREASDRGMALQPVFPAIHELGFIARLDEYRQSFVSFGEVLIIDLSREEGRTIVSLLIEDYLSLLSATPTVMVNWLIKPPVAGAAPALKELFGPYDVSLLLRPLGVPGDSNLVFELLNQGIHGLQGVVLPAEWTETWDGTRGKVLRERLLPAYTRIGESASRIAEDFRGAGELSLLLPEQPSA